MRPVAILCAAKQSIYHTLSGVDVYDADRDARTFPGALPVVAHPPCRAWSAYCAHQAKPELGEKELGLWCCEQLKRWGGVLEQPAHSRLFAAAGLPLPGQPARGGLWSANIWQSWFGYPVRKATWLCFSGIPAGELVFPLRLHNDWQDRKRWNRMSKYQRTATCLEFAEWLVDVSRRAHVIAGWE